MRSGDEQRFRWLLGATRYSGHFIGNFGGGGSAAYDSRTLPTQPFATAARSYSPIGCMRSYQLLV